jgi:hypothetical protein
MIEALAAMQRIMAILVADLACWLGASTAMTTTSMAWDTTSTTRTSVTTTVVISELSRGSIG